MNKKIQNKKYGKYMYKVENYRGRNEKIRRKIRDVDGHNRRK